MTKEPSTDQDGIIVFVDALPGFESCRRFVLLRSSEIAPFVRLQGLDEPRPAFLALDPRTVMGDYEPRLSEGERRRLDAERDDALLWLSLVRVDGERAWANLRAPVVVNPRRMIGLQVVPADSVYQLDHPLEPD
jgi:flagellar assembly factor FliW